MEHVMSAVSAVSELSNIERFNRREDSLRWAYGLGDHPVSARWAQRKATLIIGLAHWLDNNSPADATTYNDHE
jgi:hypothetical protein